MAEMLLDNFMTGPHNKTITAAEEVDVMFEPGAMAGGFRKTSFQIRSRQGLPGTLVIGPDPGLTSDTSRGRLVVSTGVDVTHRLEVVYGIRPNEQGGKLALDVRTFDRFEIDFDFIDTLVNLNIVAFTPGGVANQGVNVPKFEGSPTGPFRTVTFLFSGFTGPGENFQEIGAINIVFQTASLFRGGNDYSVKAVRLRKP
jgi:hypothetical protein